MPTEFEPIEVRVPFAKLDWTDEREALRAENERLRAALEIAKGECEGFVLEQIKDILAGHRA